MPSSLRNVLTGLQGNSRTKVLLAIIKENKLDVELAEIKPPLPVTEIAYLKLNPLGKVPTFEGANGFILTEVIAIAIYREFDLFVHKAF